MNERISRTQSDAGKYERRQKILVSFLRRTRSLTWQFRTECLLIIPIFASIIALRSKKWNSSKISIEVHAIVQSSLETMVKR